jgi:hypothetical protein
LVIDLDASALSPSKIRQSNISFHSYAARIIPPSCHQFLTTLEDYIGKKPFPSSIFQSLNKMAFDYVDRDKVQSKEQYATNVYYILCYLLDELIKYNKPITQLFEPKTTKDSIYLKTILIPLLDIINNIHPTGKQYNAFAYDYLFLNYEDLNKYYNKVYILYNPGESNSYIKVHNLESAVKTIQEYIITLAGTLFYKHEQKLGLFTNLLENSTELRTFYKNKLKEYKENSLEYSNNNSCQKTVKILMNTTKKLPLVLHTVMYVE